MSIIINLSKRPTENERQYIWRIGQAKEAGLIDLSWTELGEIFNNELRTAGEQRYDASAYRKPFQYAKQYYEDVFINMNGEDYYEDLEEKKRELQKERVKLSDEKRVYAKIVREEARDELITEQIVSAIRELNYKTPLPEPKKIKIDESKINKSWVLCFGDQHFGSEFEIKGLNGEIINAYSPEIFYRRMDDLLVETIKIINKENIKELYVYDLADQIDGVLRVSQLMKLRYSVIDQTLNYADYISKWLAKLTQYVRVNYQQVMSANHSELRMLGETKGTFSKDNMSKVVYKIIEIRLENNKNFNIKCNETGLIYEKMQGFNLLGFHGESKDLEQTLKDFQNTYNTSIDILIAGHLHHAETSTVGINKDVVRVPSIVGIDDYSLQLNKTSNPGALLFAVEQNKGKVIDYYIKLK